MIGPKAAWKSTYSRPSASQTRLPWARVNTRGGSRKRRLDETPPGMLRCARAASSADRDAAVTWASRVRTGACTLSTIYERPVRDVKEAREMSVQRSVLVTDAGELLAPGVERMRAAGA